MAALLITPLALGCGSDKNERARSAHDTRSDTSAPDQPTLAPAPRSDIRPLEENPAAAVRNDKPTRSSSADDEYFVTYSDCNALADTYGRAWENDEIAKLNQKNLKPAQHDRAAAQIHQGAITARDNWHGQCQNIVDSAMLYSRLACAAKATTMQRFNDCWDGKVEQ